MLIVTLAAALRAQDPREIVRQAIELDRHNAAQEQNYTYLQREETRELDASEKPRKVTIRTLDIRMVEGSPYRKLVARDDRPLSAEEQKFEEDKARFHADARRKESPELRQRRIAEWNRHEARRREPLGEVPDAYNFRLAGDEIIAGTPCYAIDATPKPGYKPKSTTAIVLTVLAGRIWISKRDNGWVKAEMEARDSVTLGGFLLRLSKGSRIVIEQTPVSDGVWLPKFAEIQFSARILLVKSLRQHLLFQFSDYRRSSPGPSTVAGGGAPR